jgi:preprotein translocase subunit YajC
VNRGPSGVALSPEKPLSAGGAGRAGFDAPRRGVTDSKTEVHEPFQLPMTQLALMFQGGGSMITTFLPFLLIFGVFYFLIIVPQRKRQKALADMVEALKPGDKVITSGGIYATIKQVKDKSLVVMSAEKSILEISRSSVAGMQGEEEPAPK